VENYPLKAIYTAQTPCHILLSTKIRLENLPRESWCTVKEFGQLRDNGLPSHGAFAVVEIAKLDYPGGERHLTVSNIWEAELFSYAGYVFLTSFPPKGSCLVTKDDLQV
jgi:hypothetical protein